MNYRIMVINVGKVAPQTSASDCWRSHVNAHIVNQKGIPVHLRSHDYTLEHTFILSYIYILAYKWSHLTVTYRSSNTSPIHLGDRVESSHVFLDVMPFLWGVDGLASISFVNINVYNLYQSEDMSVDTLIPTKNNKERKTKLLCKICIF